VQDGYVCPRISRVLHNRPRFFVRPDSAKWGDKFRDFKDRWAKPRLYTTVLEGEDKSGRTKGRRALSAPCFA
jgi:hypothetical protein